MTFFDMFLKFALISICWLVMVKIKVKLHGGIREIAGKSDIEVDFEEKKVDLYVVLQKISQMFGHHFRRQFFDANGEYTAAFIIAKNGLDIRRLKGLKTEVSSGDIISIVPPAAGG